MGTVSLKGRQDLMRVLPEAEMLGVGRFFKNVSLYCTVTASHSPELFYTVFHTTFLPRQPFHNVLEIHSLLHMKISG